jgi:hypothetical protein
MQVRYLISANRHFLRELSTDAYEVLDAPEFMDRWETNRL